MPTSGKRRFGEITLCMLLCMSYIVSSHMLRIPVRKTEKKDDFLESILLIYHTLVYIQVEFKFFF